jgi:hypothetical protein
VIERFVQMGLNPFIRGGELGECEGVKTFSTEVGNRMGPEVNRIDPVVLVVVDPCTV